MNETLVSTEFGEETTRRMAQRPQGQRRHQVVLRVVGGPDVGVAFVVRPGTWIVGRARRADIRLTSPSVSRAHAKLVMVAEGDVELIDLAATNPTHVNGARRLACGLRSGDRIAMGDVEMEICMEDSLPANRTRLTKRELEVARAVMDGLTNAAIGERLFISPRTVGTHLANIYERLGIRSRAELTRYLMERGVSA